METKVPELYRSLVGSSIDFSFKKKADDVQSIEKNIHSAKVRITKSLSLIREAHSSAQVMAMAALLDYYVHQSYYMAVRSCIELRRLRPDVIKYLEESTVEERAQHLRIALENTRSKARDVFVEALRYYIMLHPSKLKDFKKYLTKEEFLIVA